MAKTRKRRHSSRRRHFKMANVRHRRRSYNPHRYMAVRHRRRNAVRFGGLGANDLLWMGGGAVVNGIVARSLPQLLAPTMNTGIVGYGLNAIAGGLGAWLIGRFNRRAGQGAWIGLIVALGQRIYSEKFGSGTAAATGGMSGDLDFDMGYYLSDPFPFAQGAAAGPYGAFPGSPYSPALPTANAAAPGRWKQTAALVSAGATGSGGSGSVAMPGAMTQAYQPGAWG